MPSLPSPFLRALEGLAENSGRTVVVTGPPLSGKSELMEEFRSLLANRNARVVQLRGSYRSRSIPFGALDGLRSPEAADAPHEESATDNDSPLGVPAPPLAPIPYLPEQTPRSRRSRGERPRSSFLGQPVRGRSANEGDPEGFWHELLDGFRGPTPQPFVIFIDDAALFDADSREFIVTLSRRARYRPFLIVMALDSTNPGYIAWEEAFLGRGDVDWVRILEPLRDPREAHRLKAVFDDLPVLSQRIAGYVALLGGGVGEVVLSRVTRLSFTQLADALLPASGVGLIKVTDGKVTIPHLPWVPLTADLIPEAQRKEMHLEIANALAALSPEPNLARRIEVARHYLAWFRGPMALRNLLEAAEFSLQLLAFDSAEELLSEALGCTGAVPAGERLAVEAELRLLHARSLFSAGRLTEAEGELRDGLSGALQAHVPHDLIAEWFEPLVLILRGVGPRPALITALSELAERAHDDRAVEIEVLIEAVLAEFHSLRRNFEKARAESHRAALLARTLPEGHMQAIALVAVGLSRIDGTPEEQALAGRFLKASRIVLGKARRWELDYIAEDLEARLLESRGNTAEGRLIREKSLTALQRQKLLPVELGHRLAIVAGLLDEGMTKGVEESLARSRTIAETLHLLPPSPLLLRLWLVEGRQFAMEELSEPARERWLALIDETESTGLPGIRAEALLRLALLEYARKRPEDAEPLALRLEVPEVAAALPPAWKELLPDLARWAPASAHGGGKLPPTEPLARRREPERRERARR
ncbi:MAG TPA: ATP-binding protein [Thermoplasmata archaeon]|nr:ATP-binding protein [Thermoplasmata archaeon]